MHEPKNRFASPSLPSSRPVKKPLSARLAPAAVAAAFGVAALVGHSPDARAEEVSPKGKGIVGGAFLGAEVVTIPMALFNVRSGAAYAIGGGLGAIGGGVGGYFIEQGSDNGRAPVYMLAGGLALIIPTMVLVLNATRYMPSENASEDRAPTNGPPADPGKVGGSVVLGGGAEAATPAAPAATPPSQPGTTTPPPASPGPPELPQSLIDLRQGPGLRMGLPVPEVRPMYSMVEQKTLGVPNQAELRMPIFKATF